MSTFQCPPLRRVLSLLFQAYDIRTQSRINTGTGEKSWVQLDEEQLQRMKDREEWHRQATLRRKERMDALEEARKIREASRKAQQEQEAYSYQEMIDQMLEDLCKLNPEWEIRKEQVLRVSLGRFCFPSG